MQKLTGKVLEGGQGLGGWMEYACIYNTIMINYHYAAMPYYSMI